MRLPKHVKIIEVGPRDGLQNESTWVETKQKIDFINRLTETGLSTIEVTSFVSSKWIPQFKDASEVYQNIYHKPGINYPVLIPNVEGLNQALKLGAKSIAVFTTPSEQFSRANTNCSVAESLNRIQEVIQIANSKKLFIRGYISCVLGCPYEGEIAIDKVVALTTQLLAMGCNEISLGDTIGIGTPLQTKILLDAILKDVSAEKIAVHFHDTYGFALANIVAALELGIEKIDCSVAGLGGCPYAKGASGNVASEDVIYLCKRMGIETGVDLEKLIEVGKMICKVLRKKSLAKISQAPIR